MVFFADKRIIVGLVLMVLLAVVFSTSFAYSQNTAQPTQLTAEEQRQSNEEKAQQRRELEEQLRAYDEEIKKYQGEVEKYQAQGDSYKRQISSLNSQISRIRWDITNNELILDQTNQAIERNKSIINDLIKRKESLQSVLQQLFLAHYRQQQVDEITIILSQNNLSDFFDELHNRSVIQDELHKKVQEVRELKDQIEEEQNSLTQRVEEQVVVLEFQRISRQDLADKQGEQQTLLAQNQQTEQQLQGQVEELKQAQARIRSQLYVLQGVGVATSFGQAYSYAKVASNITGVRPAFLLALFQRESRWGQHIGSCYLTDPETGSGVNFKKDNAPRTRVMKASRDVKPFLELMAELGRDPYNTPISCPHPNYGYGGGMGPAQFIPSTWAGYKDRLANTLGRPADPFDIGDAFIASAVKLQRGGADAQTEQAEWKAAMIYYAGGNWSNPAYRSYGDWIINKAREYQADIDVLERTE